jgi:hypothetical protein
LANHRGDVVGRDDCWYPDDSDRNLGAAVELLGELARLARHLIEGVLAVHGLAAGDEPHFAIEHS